MRLLILNYEYPPLGGGAGVCAQYHAAGLERLGHKVTVVTTWFSGEPEQEKSDNLVIIRLKARRKKKYRSNPLEMMSWAWHACRYISRNRLYRETDLVMAHFAIPGGLVALPLRMLYKVPYMIVSHGQDIPWFCPRELFLYHLLFYLPIRTICRKAEKVTVLSEKRLADARRLTGPRHEHKLHVVPNGCDVGFFSPPSAGRESNLPHIIMAGRLTRQKGPLVILEAMLRLQQRSVPFRLTVIGNGPLKNTMVRFVQDRKLENCIDFSGWITREELRDYYRRAHVMLVGSSDEGMSLAILEALSTGMYIITTRVSGTEKIIQEGINGDFIRMDDPASMADALEKYCREKFMKGYQVPAKALKKVRKDISWDGVVETYNKLLA